MGYVAIRIKEPFKNKYLSVSRVKQYEKCPLAFKMGYIDENVERWHEKEAADFGKVVHEALELIFNWVDEEEFIGPVPDEVIIREYRAAFSKAEGHVVGAGRYKEGLELVRTYFRVHQQVSYLEVVATEQQFMLDIESDDGSARFQVNGVIDRVDRVGPKRIRIIDYKTNRFLFTREEVDTDLQISVYGIVAKQLWPWADDVEYAFDMLRHATRQWTRRTEAQLNEAADYMIAIGQRIESALEFPPNLNPLCPWCDFRESCKTYHDAAQKGETTLSYMMAADDLARVSEERERATALERIAKQRRKEMDRIILARCGALETEELRVGEMRYAPTQSSEIDYPFVKAIALLSEALEVPEEEVMRRVSRIGKGRMDDLIKEAGLGRGKKQLLRAKLETMATRTYREPWVRATKIVERRG
jgi:putative RecB family exonuclease